MNDATNKTDVARVLGLEHGSSWRRRGKRAILYGLLVAAVFGLGLFVWERAERGVDVRYTTQKVQRGPLTVTVTATGTVEPTNEVEISSELSGMIRKVIVDYNDRVTVGQELAELDTDKLEAQVAHSRAKVTARKAKIVEAEATVVETKRKLERTRSLEAQDFSSEEDLDVAKAAHERAVAALASSRADLLVAEADLKVDETNLEKACICSPIDGVVLNRNVDPGQYVATSFQAPVLFTLAEDLSKMQLEVDIDEADVGQVREGQAASFAVDAYPDRKFPATISELRFASETVEGVVTYKAVLSLDNSEQLLRPGMTATAEITVKQVRDALLAPNAALRFSPPTVNAEKDKGWLRSLMPGPPRFRRASAPTQTGADRSLWVLKEGTPVALRVRIGASDGLMTEIVEGDIAPGQAVIVDASASKK